jgi:4-hydroxy-3-methylbut-2-enyl diphosphate reductase
MQVITATRAGFCFGVKRAMDITAEMAKENKEGLFTLGPIIHNPQVIERLREDGIAPLDISDLDAKKVSALIIRTHGIARQTYETISSLGIRVIDATCPFVKNAQHYAKLLQENGYQVVILGDADHPEVKGIMSYAGDDAVVLDGSTSLPRLKPRIGIVVQTTQPLGVLKKVLSQIIEHAREIKVYNTICNSTALRLEETKEMAGKVDVMIVVGGRNSANTTQLANLCRAMSVRTYHVETEDELEPSWFQGRLQVGITAGASTPDWIIRKVEKRIQTIGGGIQ